MSCSKLVLELFAFLYQIGQFNNLNQVNQYYSYIYYIKMYIIPVCFIFPVEIPPFEHKQTISQISIETSNQNSLNSAVFKKEKWDSYLQIYETYLQKIYNKKGKKLWTKLQDNLLLELVSQNYQWKQISQRISNTNSNICKRRFQRISQMLAKWPEELDGLIKRMVQQQNMTWIQIHESLYSSGKNNFPIHTIKEIKQRYLLNLRPGIIIQQWKLEEDIALINAVKQKGTHWRKLTQLFQERTELQLKNRYYGIIKPLQKKVLRKLNSKMKKTNLNIDIYS